MHFKHELFLFLVVTVVGVMHSISHILSAFYYLLSMKLLPWRMNGIFLKLGCRKGSVSFILPNFKPLFSYRYLF